MKTRTIKIAVLTVMAVSMWTALTVQMFMVKPAPVENQFCPPSFHEWVEYDEAGDWALFTCDRIK